MSQDEDNNVQLKINIYNPENGGDALPGSRGRLRCSRGKLKI